MMMTAASMPPALLVSITIFVTMDIQPVRGSQYTLLLSVELFINAYALSRTRGSSRVHLGWREIVLSLGPIVQNYLVTEIVLLFTFFPLEEMFLDLAL